MKIAALLTGKGNSALANKNILPILGKPLLSYPAEAARCCRYIDYFYVSSDSAKILKIAGKIGYQQIPRPAYLSGPRSQHIDVIKHALRVIKAKDGFTPDILVVLLANSAAVKVEWLSACIKEILSNPAYSSVVPVCANADHHPFRAKRINFRGLLETFFDFKGKTISTNRQDLEPAYFLCHNFWVLNVKKSIFSKCGQHPWTFMGNKIKPFIVKDCCDVHSREDLIITENWLKKNLR